MRINIDADRCIGSGACVLASDEVFGQDDDGMVVLLVENPTDAQVGKVRNAAAACPAMVITIEE